MKTSTGRAITSNDFLDHWVEIGDFLQKFGRHVRSLKIVTGDLVELEVIIGEVKRNDEDSLREAILRFTDMTARSDTSLVAMGADIERDTEKARGILDGSFDLYTWTYFLILNE